MIQVRQANREDLPEILSIYETARSFMRQTGNPTQWGENYPAPELLQQDICQGNLYVVEEERILGVFAFIPGPDPTYRVIENGGWHRDAPYAAIHRVASGGRGGIFGQILAYCRERQPYLRIDTHRDNRVMQHVLEKHGFRACGIIYLENGDPRIAYDYA